MELRRRHAMAIIGALAVTIVGAGIASGAIPGQDGSIHACRDAHGRLRVLDAGSGGENCSKGEHPLVWAQRGPIGPAGADGLSGWQVVSAASSSNDESVKTSVAECPMGKRVVGGG